MFAQRMIIEDIETNRLKQMPEIMHKISQIISWPDIRTQQAKFHQRILILMQQKAKFAKEKKVKVLYLMNRQKSQLI